MQFTNLTPEFSCQIPEVKGETAPASCPLKWIHVLSASLSPSLSLSVFENNYNNHIFPVDTVSYYFLKINAKEPKPLTSVSPSPPTTATISQSKNTMIRPVPLAKLLIYSKSSAPHQGKKGRDFLTDRTLQPQPSESSERKADNGLGSQ